MPGKSRAKAPNKKKRSLGNANRTFELELPSIDEDGEHNVCLIRRPGPQGLIKAGILDSLDTLTGLVGSDLDDPKEAARATKEFAADPTRLKKAMDMVDKVMVHCVVDPAVCLPPENPSERDPDKLYSDDVDLDDKMFILQWVMGGTQDLETFRRETAKRMGGLEDGEGIRMPS